MSTAKNKGQWLVLPRFNEFSDNLLDRIHALMNWFLDLDSQFILFINILDRSSEEEMQKQSLVYGGIKKQLYILEHTKRYKKHFPNDLKSAWNMLATTSISPEKGISTSKLYKEFQEGKLDLDDLEIGTLYDYFKKFRETGEFENEQQSHEYPILKRFFDIESDKFISLPLIQFGYFDGVVHIIFSKSIEKNIKIRKGIIIKMISYEYENLLMDWDVVGDNMDKESSLIHDVKRLMSPEYEEESGTNPIFKELAYRRYYTYSNAYFKERLKQNDEVPNRIKDEHRKRAVIAILIDSYAHNISAHSLTAINWWFKQRAKKLLDSNLDYDIFFKENEKAIDIVNALSRQDDTDALAKHTIPLAPELQPFFKFLLEKGAFWSGVTRGMTFGGEIHNLYDILWSDFINNALYLGSIAHSERVDKINIHLSFYETYEEPVEGKKYYTYKKVVQKEGTFLSGLFAQIDLARKPAPQHRKHGQSAYVYTENSEKFDLLKAALEEIEIFFPGGVVGKHSLFTLIENEIRNVKHYKGAVLEDIRTNGLNLHLSFHQRYANTETEARRKDEIQLYKVGVWLAHPTVIDEKLITKRIVALDQDIITEQSLEPRLGGSFQDKICASMLFTNDFISVQSGSPEYAKRSKEKYKRYYPWVKASSADIYQISETQCKDFEISARKYRDIGIDKIGEHYEECLGHLKKYFHLWKGAFLLDATKDATKEVDWQWENVARFRFVSITAGDEGTLTKARTAGVIRIVNDKTDAAKEEIYHSWLKTWMKEEEFRIEIQQGTSSTAAIVFEEEKEARYYNEEAYEAIEEQYEELPSYELSFAHSSNVEEGSDVLQIRSDGILREYFFDNLRNVEDFEQANITTLKLYELIEVLRTKICIFDGRVATRIQEKRRAFLDESLLCGIYEEKLATWETIKPNLAAYHFLILHLSFIESMKDKAGNSYGEEGMVRFIEEQILPTAQEAIDAGNFILVITTGRGRHKWWREIEKSEYVRFTTFRPIESLVDVTERARLKKDDINLKHNLIKILFGS